MRASHPSPSLINREKQLEHYLHAELSPRAAYLHSISTRTAVQFPEARLIQYDCGKYAIKYRGMLIIFPWFQPAALMSFGLTKSLAF